MGRAPLLEEIRRAGFEIPSDSILAHVGKTPLIRIRRLTEPLKRRGKRVEIFAKAEWFNPSGSVKDRAALWMILDALKRGALREGMTIVEATSGNMGISLAMIGSALGFDVELCMPASVTEERVKFLMTYGARIRLTDPLEGTEGAIREAERLARESPERYFRPDQYNNPANPRAHYETTGPEIWEQTGGRVTHLVAGVGTGGTISGAGRRLKELNPRVKVVAVEPAEPLHGIAGLKFISPETKPGVYDESVVDGKVFVHIGQACETSLRLAREEGLLVGHSAGAAMWAALKVAEEVEEGVIVVIFPDSGDRYLSMGWRPR